MKSQTKFAFSLSSARAWFSFQSLPDQQFAMFVGSSIKQSEHNRTEPAGQFPENRRDSRQLRALLQVTDEMTND
jgi:hypothetical protein